MFRGNADTVRKLALERFTNHQFSLAIAISRRHIEQGDPGIDRSPDRTYAFRSRGLSPELSDPATAQGERADRPQIAKLRVFIPLS